MDTNWWWSVVVTMHSVEKEGLDFLISQGCSRWLSTQKCSMTKPCFVTLLNYPLVVLLNRTIAQISNRSVWVDNHFGAQVCSALIQLGHKQIAYVSSDSTY